MIVGDKMKQIVLSIIVVLVLISCTIAEIMYISAIRSSDQESIQAEEQESIQTEEFVAKGFIAEGLECTVFSSSFGSLSIQRFNEWIAEHPTYIIVQIDTIEFNDPDYYSIYVYYYVN